MIPNRPFSLKTIPVQCTEQSSSTFGSMPYRIFSYLEWRPLQCSEMSFSREDLTLPYSAQQSAPCTEIFPLGKGNFLSFSEGSAYSDKFPAQCTQISFPRLGFLSFRNQSSYLDKCRQNSSPKFDDSRSLRKRPSYLDNLPVQCTEISSLKDAFSLLRTRPSHLDKLPIQCSEISSLKDDFLSLRGRTTYCDKFPVQCTEMSSPAYDILSTSILPSYLDKFPIQCTEISLPKRR